MILGEGQERSHNLISKKPNHPNSYYNGRIEYHHCCIKQKTAKCLGSHKKNYSKHDYTLKFCAVISACVWLPFMIVPGVFRSPTEYLRRTHQIQYQCPGKVLMAAWQRGHYVWKRQLQTVDCILFSIAIGLSAWKYNFHRTMVYKIMVRIGKPVPIDWILKAEIILPHLSEWHRGQRD